MEAKKLSENTNSSNVKQTFSINASSQVEITSPLCGKKSTYTFETESDGCLHIYDSYRNNEMFIPIGTEEMFVQALSDYLKKRDACNARPTDQQKMNWLKDRLEYILEDFQDEEITVAEASKKIAVLMESALSLDKGSDLTQNIMETLNNLLDCD